ncbi:MAG TPA: adenylate/guanylate cyclase domain-containing protein [Gaiellaceae bacterium]|nr:adenylate/guanylate cyclase domain-containing protein [Gaiellaceae bacterium]
MTCPNCGTENAPGAKFCSECGTRLADTPAPREERKIVSVVFCDVVGSTARADTADPEDVRAALSAFYAHVRADLERFGGTVEKYIGDAVMAVFGAPVAHEDDAERAVRAALAIQDWAREDGALQVRIAVNTGEALVAVGARAEAPTRRTRACGSPRRSPRTVERQRAPGSATAPSRSIAKWERPRTCGAPRPASRGRHSNLDSAAWPPARSARWSRSCSPTWWASRRVPSHSIPRTSTRS